MVMNAFGIAVDDIAGQNFGARQYDRMKRCTRVGLGMCLHDHRCFLRCCLFSAISF